MVKFHVDFLLCTRSVEMKHWLLKSKKIGHVFQWGETYLSKTREGQKAYNVCLRVLCMRGISGSEKPQKDAEVHFNDPIV